MTVEASGFRTSRTLTVRTELRRQATMRRTRLSLGIAAGLPLVILVALGIGGGNPASGGSSQLSDLSSLASSGGANFAVFCFFLSGWFMLAVIVAMFFGDSVAGEASQGTLRYLLVIPVSRSRLLRVKLTVATIYSVTCVCLLIGIALAVGSLRYGWSPLHSNVGDDLRTGTSLLRLAGAAAYVCMTLSAVAAVAFFLSVSTNATLGAVGGGVMFFIISSILDQITVLGPLRSVFPTHYSDAWLGLLGSPPDTLNMARGTALALAYTCVFFTLAWVRFLHRDVTD